MRRLAAGAGLLLLVLTACGQQPGPPTAAPAPPDGELPTSVPPPTGSVTGWGTVLDAERPELCLAGLAESLPPQCSGVPLDGWDWSRWAGAFEQASGVRWGEFTVTGTYDGRRMVVEQVQAGIVAPPLDPEPRPHRTTPCPVPESGWRVLDPELATDETMNRTFRSAARLEGYAGAWMDQSPNPVNPDDPDVDPAVVEREMNDPRLLIVNVQVTGDAAVAERELRKIWGGMLCVSRAEHTEAELSRVQQRLNELPGMLWSGSASNAVEVGVLWDDGSLQVWADTTYGAGLVEIRSALRPAG